MGMYHIHCYLKAQPPVSLGGPDLKDRIDFGKITYIAFSAVW